MSSNDRLVEIERKIQYLTDRQAILDCIVRNSRGNDRFDTELVASSYHVDGLHEIGRNAIPGPKYGEHANHAHRAMCEQNLHHVTMHSCELDGDVAHAESYVIGLFLNKGTETSRILSGSVHRPAREARWRMANSGPPRDCRGHLGGHRRDAECVSLPGEGLRQRLTGQKRSVVRPPARAGRWRTLVRACSACQRLDP